MELSAFLWPETHASIPHQSTTPGSIVLAALSESHREFLSRNGVDPAELDALDEDQIEAEMEKDLRDQIEHNIYKGVLKQTAAGEVKYSWGGMIYLWCQFLVDLVRL